MMVTFTESLILFVKRSFFLVLTVWLGTICCFASETAPEWTVAAESFTSEGLPEVYSMYTTVLPQLILTELSRINNRLVFASERQERQVRQILDARLKLIQEKSALLRDKDKILLSNDSRYTKTKKRRDIQKRIEDKDVEIAKKGKLLAEKMGEARIVDDQEYRLTLWKKGENLYKRSESYSLAKSLYTDGISALLTGQIEDIAGYMQVTVRLDTGYGSVEQLMVSEVSPYDDLDLIIQLIVARLLPDIANRPPVLLDVAIDPPDAKFFIDGRLVLDPSVPVSVFSGTHNLSVTSAGYRSASRTVSLDGFDRFTVNIALEKEEMATLAFNTQGLPADLFIHTTYIGETPREAEVPRFPIIGEILSDGVKTYFLVDGSLYPGDGNHFVTIRENRYDTGKRIEQLRKTMYWSLGFLYLSLPVSMISYGVATNKYKAYQDGKIPYSQEFVDELDSWAMVADVSKWVSIGLGINFAVQLARYIWAANQTIPKTTY